MNASHQALLDILRQEFKKELKLACYSEAGIEVAFEQAVQRTMLRLAGGSVH